MGTEEGPTWKGRRCNLWATRGDIFLGNEPGVKGFTATTIFVFVILRKQTLPEQFLKSRSYRGLNYFLDICLQSVNFILSEVRLALNFTEWLEKNRFLNFSIQMTLDLSRNGLKRVLLSL